METTILVIFRKSDQKMVGAISDVDVNFRDPILIIRQWLRNTGGDVANADCFYLRPCSLSSWSDWDQFA